MTGTGLRLGRHGQLLPNSAFAAPAMKRPATAVATRAPVIFAFMTYLPFSYDRQLVGSTMDRFGWTCSWLRLLPDYAPAPRAVLAVRSGRRLTRRDDFLDAALVQGNTQMRLGWRIHLRRIHRARQSCGRHHHVPQS